MGTLPQTYKGGLISMTLHYFTLMILAIGTSRTNEIQYIKYTSEYIPKLQIHQQSLLTRNVFSSHHSLAQVFIIGSSSKLDHHLIIIIIIDSDMLIKWWYISILLSIGSSTEPTLFHAGFRPSLHLGLHWQSQPFFHVGCISTKPVLFHTECRPL